MPTLREKATPEQLAAERQQAASEEGKRSLFDTVAKQEKKAKVEKKEFDPYGPVVVKKPRVESVSSCSHATLNSEMLMVFVCLFFSLALTARTPSLCPPHQTSNISRLLAYDSTNTPRPISRSPTGN